MSLPVFFQRCHEPKILGKWDCCIAVADHLFAEKGIDLFAEFRGRYRSEIGFRRLLKSEGCNDLGEAIEKMALRHGFVEVGVVDPRKNDLGIIGFAETGGQITPVPAFFYDGFWNGFGDGYGISVMEAHRAWRIQ